MTKVMIIEDNFLIADLIREMLETDGYIITGMAASVEEALETFHTNPCDYAIIDVHLANGDLGTDAAKQLRHAESNIGIIFSTGSNDAKLMEGLGDALLIKPFRMCDIAQTIEIVKDVRTLGQTDRSLPRGFRFI